MNEFLEQFLIESRELVEQATGDLLALEEAPQDKARLDGAFRAFHTLKGAAGIVDFPAMEQILHGAEDILAAVRAGDHPVTADLISDCLSCLDQIVQWLDVIDIEGEVPAVPAATVAALTANFEAAAHPLPAVTRPSPAADGPVVLSPEAHAVLQEQLLLVAEAMPEGWAGRLGSAVLVAAQILRDAGRAELAGEIERAGGEGARAGHPGAFAAVVRGFLTEPAAPGILVAEPSRETPGIAVRALRVEVARIDALVKLTGELTVVKNGIAHAARLAQAASDPAGLARTLEDQYKLLDRLVAELQRSVLGVRVLPLRHVFQRLPRLVRELAASLGKSVRLVTEGDATEADKAVVETLFEPLLHVLRNAVDHGIEPEDERRAAGKPATATIRLGAARVGEHVTVEITDDGRGIDTAEVRQVARDRGIVAPDALAAMSEDEIIELVFAPGFTTARAVSGVSGRGVGMDAVRAAIDQLGGRVTLTTRAGHGVRVLFTLPFSMMMSRVMTVEAGGQVFGILLDSIIETVRVPRGDIRGIGTARAFVRRQRTVPLVALAEILGLEPSGEAAEEANIVIVAMPGELGAVEVDRFGERLDAILTPLDGLLAGIGGVAGTTLLGDGRVLIVLDIEDLMQ